MMIFALVQCYQSKTCACAFMLFWHVWVALCIYSLCTLCGHLYPRHLPHWKLNFFPGCEPSIPAAIDMPLVPRKLTTLMEPAWAHHRALLGPAYNGLHRFRAWFCAFYDVALHREVIDAVNDSLLLLASIADFCGVPIEQPVFLGSNSSLYSFSPTQS